MYGTCSPPGVGGVEALIPGEGLVHHTGDSRMEEGIWNSWTSKAQRDVGRRLSRGKDVVGFEPS